METKTPQDIAQYQEHYSESGLFAKIEIDYDKSILRITTKERTL